MVNLSTWDVIFHSHHGSVVLSTKSINNEKCLVVCRENYDTTIIPISGIVLDKDAPSILMDYNWFEGDEGRVKVSLVNDISFNSDDEAKLYF